MIAERVLTVCVGISNYDASLLVAGEKPLEFLASSASELSELFRSAWPTDESHHLVVLDRDATWAQVRALLADRTPAYDLAVLYLGGHGRLRDGTFQFVFSADSNQSHFATSAALDELAGLAKAKHVLLLLDACHAGRYVEESSFFRFLAPDRARLCLASSLPDQSSWEDAYFKRSLFAEAVIKALTSQPGIPSVIFKRADAAFDEIAQDISRHAFALKRSAPQEPAMTGAWTVPLFLPVTTWTGRGRSALTTYQALLRRSRQIGMAAVCLVVVAAGIVSAVTWRPAINGSGLLEIRPGPKWLAPLNVGPWRLRVETESSTADLRDENDYPAARAELRDEEGAHPWPGEGQAAVRRWADALIEEHLNDLSAGRWRVRLGYSDAVQRLKVSGVILRSLPTTPLNAATKLAAEATILAPSRPLPDIWEIQWRNMLAPGRCEDTALSQDQKDQLSFYLRSQTADVVEWLKGVALTARIDDAVDMQRVVALVKMLSSANRLWKNEYARTSGAPGEPLTGASIAARFTERPTPAETTAVAAIVTAIVERRLARGTAPLSDADRESLVALMEGCVDVGVHALAASSGDPARVIAWAHTRNRADQGRIPLLLLASRGALPPVEIARVLSTLGFEGDAADKKRAFVYAREWLSSVAERMTLPPDLLHAIVDYAAQRKNAGDENSARDATTLLTHTFRSLSTEDRARVVVLLQSPTLATPFLPLPQPAIEQLGLLASTGAVLTAEQRSHLMAIIDRSSSHDPSRINFVDTDRTGREDVMQLVPGLNSTHLLAFARFVASAPDGDSVLTDPRTLPFLEQAVADGIRTGVRVIFLRSIIHATARARRALSGAPEPEAIIGRLREHSQDAAKRFASSAISIAQLSSATPERRVELLDQLRALWTRESEPEIKLSLAAIIVGTISPPDAVPRPTR